MKYIPNILSLLRVILSFVLLLLTPFSEIFFIIYLFCGVSDILDGAIARSWKLESQTGALLDSVADVIFVAVMLIILVPLQDWPIWILGWIGIIVVIRLLSLGVGFVKYQTLTFLHTIANKVTGLALFCYPFLFLYFDHTVATTFFCFIASLSAIEELMINITSQKLERNIRSFFDIYKS